MQGLNGRKRIATYERTSSEDQRERATIKTQTEEIARHLQLEPTVDLVERYVDDGVSGTIPMAERPAGGRLMDDARRGHFQEVWVYRIDRLGRDDIDPLVVWRQLEAYGVKVYSVTEGVSSPFEYHIRVAMNAEERRTFLARSSAGMDRAAREGRYTGGIRPLGYRVAGERHNAHLEPNDGVIWGDWTEADLVRRIYNWLGVDGRSCRWIAEELNRLGVPTAYQRDGRGVRGKKTQGKWRPGRIRNLVVNPLYKGDKLYGRRSKNANREVLSGSIEPLVSGELWDAAQHTLASNRIMPRNTTRRYLLRSVIMCGLCGLHFSGSTQRDKVWYRCDGYLVERGPKEGRCPAKSIAGPDIESQVWRDIERFLRNPGEVLKELQAEREMNSAAAVAEAERQTVLAALNDLTLRKQRLLDLVERGSIPPAELEERFAKIDGEAQALTDRLRDLDAEDAARESDVLSDDLLAELRDRLDAGLDDVQRNEIVKLLVRKITIYTGVQTPRKKQARAVVEYRFPAPAVVNNRRGTGSSR